MASLTLSFPSAFAFLEIFSRHKKTMRNHRPASDSSPEATRARREFIHDMLARNADAFASEMDVHNMMYQFPGRF